MWDKFKLLTSDLWTIVKPSIVLFLTSYGRKVLQVALTLVAEAATQDISGREKRDFVINGFKQQINDAPNDMVNLAIEIAYQKLK